MTRQEKKMKKYLITSIIVSLLICPLQVAQAGGIIVDYPGKPGPLFNELNWAPGESATNTITITNDNTNNQKVGFQINGSYTPGLLANIIILTVKDNPGGTIRYENTLAALHTAGELELDTLPPSTQKKYDFIATFNPSAGNEYQGLSEVFDMTIGFIATREDDDNGGDGPPPIIIIPTPQGGAIAGIQSLTGLAFGEQVTEPEEGEIAGVTDEKEQPEEEKEETEDKSGVAGVRTCPWWAIISIILALALILYGLRLEREEFNHRLPRFWNVWPTVFGVIAFVAHYFLHKGYKSTWFCDWFWLIVLIEILIAYALYYLFIKKENKEEKQKNMPF